MRRAQATPGLPHAPGQGHYVYGFYKRFSPAFGAVAFLVIAFAGGALALGSGRPGFALAVLALTSAFLLLCALAQRATSRALGHLYLTDEGIELRPDLGPPVSIWWQQVSEARLLDKSDPYTRAMHADAALRISDGANTLLVYSSLRRYDDMLQQAKSQLEANGKALSSPPPKQSV